MITLAAAPWEPGPDPSPISAIQGASHLSPLLGREVTTEGVVTTVAADGFYLQDPVGDDDPATSEAVFVETPRHGTDSPFVFQDPASAAAFDEYIAGESCLDEQRGRIMERNSCRNPWQNQLDVAIRQRLPVWRGDAAFEIQIFNFLRMLDRDWGQVKTVGGGEFFDQQVLDVVDATDEAERRHLVTFNRDLLTRRFQPVSSNASINRSTYYVQGGLKYSF